MTGNQIREKWGEDSNYNSQLNLQAEFYASIIDFLNWMKDTIQYELDKEKDRR